jgi:DNA-binding MarR family transcriptional regulator
MAKSALQHELRKKRPFASPEVEASLNLVRTQDQLQGEFARLFDEHGLSPAQYNVLRILRGHVGEGLPCQEIAAQMVTRMPDITRLVDRLEKAGLVERGRTHQDRRVVLVSITRAGLENLAALDGPVLELHRKLLGHMTREELTELNRLLVKARRAEAPGD